MLVEYVLLQITLLLRPKRAALVRAHELWFFTTFVFLVRFQIVEVFVPTVAAAAAKLFPIGVFERLQMQPLVAINLL